MDSHISCKRNNKSYGKGEEEDVEVEKKGPLWFSCVVRVARTAGSCKNEELSSVYLIHSVLRLLV